MVVPSIQPLWLDKVAPWCHVPKLYRLSIIRLALRPVLFSTVGQLCSSFHKMIVTDLLFCSVYIPFEYIRNFIGLWRWGMTPFPFAPCWTHVRLGCFACLFFISLWLNGTVAVAALLCNGQCGIVSSTTIVGLMDKCASCHSPHPVKDTDSWLHSYHSVILSGMEGRRVVGCIFNVLWMKPLNGMKVGTYGMEPENSQSLQQGHC